MHNYRPLFLFLFLLCIQMFPYITDGIELIIVNNCKETIWPGILANDGNVTPEEGGFRLFSGSKTTVEVPDQWSGRIWPRRGCYFDKNANKGLCQTGDCAGLLKCRGIGGVPPTTVVEMSFGTSKSPLHYYDVSLVDGFNVPVSMSPLDGYGKCEVAGCEADLNDCCPYRLTVMWKDRVVACKSGCLATKVDSDCCIGEYASPENCKPNVFGKVFKAICPDAYSFAFDSASGLKTCLANRYVITFCPTSL